MFSRNKSKVVRNRIALIAAMLCAATPRRGSLLYNTRTVCAAFAAAICAATGALYAEVPQVQGTDFFFQGAAQNTYRLSQITSGWQYKNVKSGYTYDDGTYPGIANNVYLRGEPRGRVA